MSLAGFEQIAQMSDHPQCTLFSAKTQNGKSVVIKVLKKKMFEWEEVLKLPEVNSLRRVEHPNVIRLLEVRKDEGDVSFVFEQAEGMLVRIPDMGGRVEEIENWAGDVLFQVANGVLGLHSKGVLHRDIRKGNVFNLAGRWVLGGFKESKYIRRRRNQTDDEDEYRTPITQERGELYVRSPECLLGLHYSYPTDIFGLGIFFLELLTGKSPFDSTTALDQISQIILMMGIEELQDWSSGWSKYRQIFGNASIKTHIPKRLSHYLPDNLSQKALLLLDSMLKLDPDRRATIVEVLHHPFFQSKPHLKSQPHHPAPQNSEHSTHDPKHGKQPNLPQTQHAQDERPDSAFSPIMQMLSG